uniref:RING-type domain-containing protein n=1 Tax=Oryza barthii TaxID=65489 RepID=A0A0D3HI27_9ORYZ
MATTGRLLLPHDMLPRQRPRPRSLFWRPTFQRPNAAAAVPEGYSNGRFGSVPACSEAIAALEETSPGEAKEKDCSVCLEAFEEESDKLMRKMPCCHAFHESCIFEWLQVSRLCPLCRFALPTQAEAEAGLWPLLTPGSGSGT